MTWRAQFVLGQGVLLFQPEFPDTPMMFDLSRDPKQLMGLRGRTAKGEIRSVDHVVIRECGMKVDGVVG